LASDGRAQAGVVAVEQHSLRYAMVDQLHMEFRYITHVGLGWADSRLRFPYPPSSDIVPRSGATATTSRRTVH